MGRIPGNLDEMNRFLEAQNLSRQNHEKNPENLNRPITSKETELVIEISQQQKAPDILAPWAILPNIEGTTQPSQTFPKY